MERAGLELSVDCPPPARAGLRRPRHVGEDRPEPRLQRVQVHASRAASRSRSARRASRSSCRVEDTGTGIPADELPRLFERFHRVEGARGRTHEGTGIGLALVQELARLHGGESEVESTFGAGQHVHACRSRTGRTTCPPTGSAAAVAGADGAWARRRYVEEALRWLPAATASRRHPAAETTPGPRRRGRRRHADAAAATAAHPPGRRQRRHAAITSAACSPSITRCAAVADGLHALEAARREPPDLILSDVMMPGLDGFGLLRELRADDRTRRRSRDPALRPGRARRPASRASRPGADDYLTKPFGARELLARVAVAARPAPGSRRQAEQERERRRRAARPSSRASPTPSSPWTATGGSPTSIAWPIASSIVSPTISWGRAYGRCIPA